MYNSDKNVMANEYLDVRGGVAHWNLVFERPVYGWESGVNELFDLYSQWIQEGVEDKLVQS